MVIIKENAITLKVLFVLPLLCLVWPIYLIILVFVVFVVLCVRRCVVCHLSQDVKGFEFSKARKVYAIKGCYRVETTVTFRATHAEEVHVAIIDSHEFMHDGGLLYRKECLSASSFCEVSVFKVEATL